MKNFKETFILVLLIIMTMNFTFSCGDLKSVDCSKKIDTIEVRDTIIIEDKIKVDSLNKILVNLKDSLKFYRDSIEYKDYINARRIEKVKYYINICEKNSSQKKYFFGWIKRAVSE